MDILPKDRVCLLLCIVFFFNVINFFLLHSSKLYSVLDNHLVIVYITFLLCWYSGEILLFCKYKYWILNWIINNLKYLYYVGIIVISAYHITKLRLKEIKSILILHSWYWQSCVLSRFLETQYLSACHHPLLIHCILNFLIVILLNLLIIL